MEPIRIVKNKLPEEWWESVFGEARAREVRRFHGTFSEYEATPLADLKELAGHLGVAGIYVKDESRRFGLNAFKALGSSFAIANVLREKLGLDEEEMTFQKLNSPEVREQTRDMTFVTATDGNHGRGVAWTASRLGAKSVVYMPKGSAAERLRNIRAAGAEAEITEWNYDDTVRFAGKQAEEQGWTLVQDTAWEGYRRIPRWIMEGYLTMADEAAEQLQGSVPTHVFLQAGVGSMAGAVAAYFANRYRKTPPAIVVVEPHAANCIFRTAEAADGELHTVTGDMDSICAGLCCGEPCSIAWELLRDHAEYFASIPDETAAMGMRILGNPLGKDPKVVSGESGAAGLGLAAALLTDPALEEQTKILGLDENARILCFSTEGDTDRENYRDIVWKGKYPY
jgi:diaminopropionate ammonia-lyase